MERTTLQITRATRDKLHVMGQVDGQSMGEVVEALVELAWKDNPDYLQAAKAEASKWNGVAGLA